MKNCFDTMKKWRCKNVGNYARRYYTAVALSAMIGDINRFPSSEKLSSYFGLVPSTKQSGNKAIMEI